MASLPFIAGIAGSMKIASSAKWLRIFSVSLDFQSAPHATSPSAIAFSLAARVSGAAEAGACLQLANNRISPRGIKTLKVYLEDKNFDITFTTIRVESSKAGDLAYSHGTYVDKFTDPKTNKPVSETGKYVCVYRKEADGAWKSILDINNADGPAMSGHRIAQ
jgi:hypothetical protein